MSTTTQSARWGRQAESNKPKPSAATTHEFDSLVRQFDSAMLVTIGKEGAPHGRPMHIVKYESGGTFYFVSPPDTGKMSEIEDDSHAAVILQDDKRYCSAVGTARELVGTTRDGVGWDMRVPGRNSARVPQTNLCLIRFTANNGEFWDLSLRGGARYAWKRMLAALKSHPAPARWPEVRKHVEFLS